MMDETIHETARARGRRDFLLAAAASCIAAPPGRNPSPGNPPSPSG